MENPFSLTDEKLKTLLDAYFRWLESYEREKEYINFQEQLSKDLRKTLLNKNYLSSVSKKDLAQEIFDYSRKLEGPVHIRLGRPRILNSTDKIKRRLLYLIDSPDDPFEKTAAILEGKHRIPIFARAFWTPIFQAQFPKVLPNWNNKTNRFLRELGINLTTSRLSVEEKYRRISEAFLYLRELDPRHNFYTLNHLMHYGTEIPEGKNLIMDLKGGGISQERDLGGKEVSYWRVIEPLDTHDYVIWPKCKEKGLIAIGFANDPEDYSVKRMRDKMKVGDEVIAYLAKGRIGGVGTIIGEYEDASDEKPVEEDYFNGNFWRRRKVRWDHLPDVKEYWQLPQPYSETVPGGRPTIVQLTKDQFNKILAMREVKDRVPFRTSQQFKGFTKETFELLKQLSKDTSYQTVKPLSKEIHERVVYPLRVLFRDMARDFDFKEILNLEKERGVISRLFKANPRLGAWPYIWGAFYPKGESRITSMQFFVWMDKDCLTYGIYPSMNNLSIKESIIENLNNHGDQLQEYLPENFYQDFSFYTDYGEGKQRKFFKPKEYKDLISFYKKYPLNVGKVVAPEEVIKQGPNLVGLIREDFEKLVPLYVFGISESPITLLNSYYLGEGEEPEEIEISKEAVLKEIFLAESKFDQILTLLGDVKKKQIIFQGPPGTGKTFIARELALYLAQSKDRVGTIQFHPSYSYEDFIEGYRPSKDKGFQLTSGIFKKFCQEARTNQDKKYLLIIDEINRGNLSKIFGELLYLLEYRDQKAKLTYSQERFSIPENLYIIGTMNTADRSLAIMDYALRRRFYFVSLTCQTKRLGEWLKANGCKVDVDGLIAKIEVMNQKIAEEMRSKDFIIGHSYFMKKDLDGEKLEEIMEFEIKPLLEEYFFDKKEKVKEIIEIVEKDAG